MTNQKTNKWKIVAIVFISLFVLETSFLLWGMYLVDKEERLTMECYYEVCEDYPSAYFEDDLCSCIDYDVLGYEIIPKQEYMG